MSRECEDLSRRGHIGAGNSKWAGLPRRTSYDEGRKSEAGLTRHSPKGEGGWLLEVGKRLTIARQQFV